MTNEELTIAVYVWRCHIIQPAAKLVGLFWVLWEASKGLLARGLGRRCNFSLRGLEGQFTRARKWGDLKLQNRKGFGVFRVRGRVLEGFWRGSGTWLGVGRAPY